MADLFDMDAPNVYGAQLTVKQLRDFIDGSDLPDDVTTAMDEAQGRVHSRESSEAFIVLRVTP